MVSNCPCWCYLRFVVLLQQQNWQGCDQHLNKQLHLCLPLWNYIPWIFLGGVEEILNSFDVFPGLMFNYVFFDSFPSGVPYFKCILQIYIQISLTLLIFVVWLFCIADHPLGTWTSSYRQYSLYFKNLWSLLTEIQSAVRLKPSAFSPLIHMPCPSLAWFDFIWMHSGNKKQRCSETASLGSVICSSQVCQTPSLCSESWQWVVGADGLVRSWAMGQQVLAWWVSVYSLGAFCPWHYPPSSLHATGSSILKKDWENDPS